MGWVSDCTVLESTWGTTVDADVGADTGPGGLLELGAGVRLDHAGIQRCPETLTALGLANFLPQRQVMRHDAPRTLCVEHAQFGAVKQERTHASQVVRIQVDEQLLADQAGAAG